jgi:hypothetical protein
VRGRQDDVIDVEWQVGEVVSIFINKERRITGGGREVELAKIHSKPLVPRAGRLFQAVEGLLQQTDMIRCRWVDEARRLLAVDSLLKTTTRKAFLTSNWWIGDDREVAMLRTTRIVASLTSGLKVSS